MRSKRSRAVRQLRSPIALASSVELDDVDEEHRRKDAVGIVRLRARAGEELLDRAQQVRLGQRPVVGAVSSTNRAPAMFSAR